MTDARPVGVVEDTMVISWLFDQRPNPVADRYRTLIETMPVLLAFQMVMELREGSRQVGHPLRDKVYDGDRWIAAAAIRLGLPLVSHDGVFAGAPRLELITAAPGT